MDQHREAVLLNIYNMYWTNQYTSFFGVGVFHTGVEVFGTEFAYGGHPFEFSGIFEISPRDADELGEHYQYKESIVLGYTSFTKEEVKQAVGHLGRDFKGTHYHLMNKNCNHFSGELCQLLSGQEIPNWVNRLAYVSTCIPFLEKCLPKEWLTPSALEETVKLATGNGTLPNSSSGLGLLSGSAGSGRPANGTAGISSTRTSSSSTSTTDSNGLGSPTSIGARRDSRKGLLRS